METLCLRPVSVADCDLLWEWANEEEVRQNSFNTEPIPLEEHKAWLSGILNDENIRFYILQDADEPVGQVRMAFKKEWQISYSIAPANRGQGYGKLILQLAENELIRDGHTGELLFAEVKAGNIPSQRIFSGLGYQKIDSKRSEACAYIKAVAEKVYNLA